MMIEKNKYYIEVIRIIAIFLVIFNHTSINGSILYTKYLPSDPQYWICLFFSILCQINVPLFFMISGALLLNKEKEEITYIFKHRVSRMMIALIGISVSFAILINVCLKGGDFSVIEIVQKIYTCGFSKVYWFMYAYIGFLFSLPLLRCFVKSLNDRHFLYLIVLGIIFIILKPLFETFILDNSLHLTKDLDVRWMLSKIVIYPVIGYYIENKLDMNYFKWRHIILLCVLLLFTIIFSSYIIYLDEYPSGKHKGTYRYLFAFLNTIIVFLVIKYSCYNVKVLEKCKNILYVIGSSVFGVYLLHPILMRIVEKCGIWRLLHTYI